MKLKKTLKRALLLLPYARHLYFRGTIDEALLSKLYRQRLESARYKIINEQVDNYDCGIFSQFGEDILLGRAVNRLIHQLPQRPTAIEYGAGGYSSNIALLAHVFNFRCFFFDGSRDQLSVIRQLLVRAYRLFGHEKLGLLRFNQLFIRFKDAEKDLKASINSAEGNPFVASVDIDSYDEIIIDFLMKRDVPIIIAEYNSCFGESAPITITRDGVSHPLKKSVNGILPCFGISYKALLQLAESNNYFCWRVEPNGVNMILIHQEFSGLFPDSSQQFYLNVQYPNCFSEDELRNLQDLHGY